MSTEPQIMRSRAGERVVGKVYTALELATLLNKQAGVLRACEGGVTFSGGEPLMQAQFVSEVIDLLEDLHVVLDTSGYASEGDLRMVAGKSDLVYYDLKLVDRQAHLHYTGVDSAPILSNLRVLSSMGLPFVVRVPLIPSVTDTRDNLLAIAETIRELPGLERVDLLPYNKAAGGKYKGLGMEFQPAFDEGRDVNIHAEPFVRAGITVNVGGVDMAALGSRLVSCQ